MSKDNSGKEIADSLGTVFSENEVEQMKKYRFSGELINVMREFGIMGMIAYVGGIIMLILFPMQSEFNKQVLYSISGLTLLFLATFISYARINAQREREKFLIEMTQNANNRLAEQLGKGMNNDQIAAIIQKIRQNQRDLFEAIFKNGVEK